MMFQGPSLDLARKEINDDSAAVGGTARAAICCWRDEKEQL